VYRTNRGFKCGEKQCAKKFNLALTKVSGARITYETLISNQQ
jgi:hypothetical protein